MRCGLEARTSGTAKVPAFRAELDLRYGPGMVSVSVLSMVSELLVSVPEAATSAWAVFFDGFAGSIVGAVAGATVTVVIFLRTLKHAKREADESRDESRAALKKQLEADLEARRRDRLVSATGDWMSAVEAVMFDAGKVALFDSQRSLKSVSNRVRIELRHRDDELEQLVMKVSHRIVRLASAVPEWDDSNNDENVAARAESRDALTALSMSAVEHMLWCVSAPSGSTAYETSKSLLRRLAVEPTE